MHKLAALILAASGASAPGYASSLADCTAIHDDQARLACYDKITGRLPGDTSAVTPTANAGLVGPPAASQEATASENEAEQFVSPRLFQEKSNVNNRFVIIPHRRNYLLPVSYNSQINEDIWEDLFPGTGMDDVEAKFQISFKAIVWQAIFGEGIDLWGAYTQQNWMQTYNTDASSPFRETNYQPELILSVDNDWTVFGFHNTRLDFSFNHQSNGRSEPLSRSWNRLMGSALFERNNFSLRGSGWYRVPENNKDDDNPEIDKYIGRAELQGIWKWPDYSLGLTVRNNLESDNRGSVQIDWTFPLSSRFRGYVQYFHGYGESLIDYNVSTNRIGIGVSLTDPI